MFHLTASGILAKNMTTNLPDKRVLLTYYGATGSRQAIFRTQRPKSHKLSETPQAPNLLFLRAFREKYRDVCVVRGTTFQLTISIPRRKLPRGEREKKKKKLGLVGKTMVVSD